MLSTDPKIIVVDYVIYGIQTKSHKVNYSQAPTCFCKVIAFCGLWFIRYANEEAGDHCHVKILDLYLSKLPAGFSQKPSIINLCRLLLHLVLGIQSK